MKGYISGYDGRTLSITVPFSDAGLLQKQEITECEVRLTDGRTITPAQRRKIFAMVRDIADWATWAKDRRQIHHLGQLVQPLCRQHHQEVDQVGQASFDKKYHLCGIRLDEFLCKKLKWRI